MGSTTFKAGTSKGAVFLVDTTSPSYKQGSIPTIKTSDGKTYQGKLYNTVNEGSGAIQQFIFPGLPPGADATIDYGGATQSINTSKYFTGNGVGNLQNNPAKNASNSVTSNGNFQQVGQFGVAPIDISGEFPKAQTTFTDPTEFAKEFQATNLQGLSYNSQAAGSLALAQLDTELQGLKAYAPAAAALKQNLIGQDNAFNQVQRTSQIQSTIPGVLKDLDAQAADARSYAEGKVPNAVADRGLTLQDRAAAADQSSSGGFGPQSSAARSVSDLLSAKDRIGLSQYGESLTSQNAAQQAALRLAPTEYSSAGNDISAAPSVSGSQLSQSNFNAINAATLISPETALTSTINQNEFNTTNLNDFALSLFNYKVGLSNAVAQAGQVNINTGVGIDQQNAARDEASKQANRTRRNNTIRDAVGVAATVGQLIWCDKDLKLNIKPENKGIDVIKNTSVYTYTYKENSPAYDNGVQHIGVIAQELKEVLPEAVSIDYETGYLKVDQTSIIYMLVNAVKTLTKAIEDHGIILQ